MARAEAFVGRIPAASTRAVTCAASPRAFHGAWRACARSKATFDSGAMRGRGREVRGAYFLGCAFFFAAGLAFFLATGFFLAGALAGFLATVFLAGFAAAFTGFAGAF